MSDSSKVSFIDNHVPGLEDGDYRLTIKQSLQTADGSGFSAADATQFLYFSVAGPRYSLDPSLINSVFPPERGVGEYSNVLPHIIFNRSTLPWERRIDEADSGIPWMALLVLNQDEVEDHITPQTVAVSDIKNGLTADPANGQGSMPAMAEEVGQTDTDLLQVIDVPLSLLKATVPPKGDLQLLAHVRLNSDDSLNTDDGSASQADPDESDLFPVLVANRLPAMGLPEETTGQDAAEEATGQDAPGQEASVFLVSLEGRSDIYTALAQYSEDTRDDLYRLVMLKTWTFTALAESKTFTDYLMDAARIPASGESSTTDNLLRLDSLNTASGDSEAVGLANGLLNAGFVPCPHEMRQGNQTVSWYRGPLVPGLPAGNSGSSVGSKADFETIGVKSQDQLVRYISNAGMFDLSYAAAWQLGQLLTLKNTSVGVALYNWKRQRALAAQPADSNYLPFSSTPVVPPLPDNVAQWFRDLAQFKNVPFNYLVADEAMLPVESIRFFKVDPVWREVLIDGAFSVGRVLDSDADLDKQERDTVWGSLSEPLAVSGFLLRSHVVEGWPSMQVEGYTTLPAVGEDKEEGFATPLNMVRMERLGTDILLCLFDGDLQTVDLHEVPEVIHFGVSYDPENPIDVIDANDSTNSTWTSSWYKAYRDTDTVEELSSPCVDVTQFWDESTHTLQIKALAGALAKIGLMLTKKQKTEAARLGGRLFK
ncbi:MAG: hypothetical protein R3E95_01430 [Thiolinea sp.]